MAKTTAELIHFIDTRLSEYSSMADGRDIGSLRASTLQRIRTFLLDGRFPATEDERYELSLVPFIFQEANYDGIDWGPGTSTYGQLQDLFDLDFYVALGGRERSEVTKKESRRYWRACHRFISRRTGQPNIGPVQAGLLLLVAKLWIWLEKLWKRK